METKRRTHRALAIGLLVPAAAVIGAAQGAEKPPKPTAADMSQHLAGANYHLEVLAPGRAPCTMVHGVSSENPQPSETRIMCIMLNDVETELARASLR